MYVLRFEKMKKMRVVSYIVPMGLFLAFIFTSNISIVYQGNQPKPINLIVNKYVYFYKLHLMEFSISKPPWKLYSLQAKENMKFKVEA